jgi:hypothetical protein
LAADQGSAPTLLGWLDDDFLIVETWDGSRLQLDSVDASTGKTHTLTTFDQPDNSDVQFASELVRSPVVDAVAPPQPWNPLKVAATAALAALALLLTVLALRRRRARR